MLNGWSIGVRGQNNSRRGISEGLPCGVIQVALPHLISVFLQHSRNGPILNQFRSAQSRIRVFSNFRRHYQAAKRASVWNLLPKNPHSFSLYFQCVTGEGEPHERRASRRSL
ncbi:hypothetical protein SERLA73DRAFT_147204, partial [Serpula lacrymans var. lacrymans S7.3]